MKKQTVLAQKRFSCAIIDHSIQIRHIHYSNLKYYNVYSASIIPHSDFQSQLILN